MNKINSEELKILAEALKVNLRKMRLSSNRICDQKCIALADVFRWTRVEKISLNYNYIQNEGCMALVGALEINQSIKEIDVSSNPLSAEGKKLLKEKENERSNLKIKTEKFNY